MEAVNNNLFLSLQLKGLQFLSPTKKILSFYITFVLCFVLGFSAFGQTVENRITAHDAFNTLTKEGGLIVRLPTKSTTIKAMEEMLDEGEISARNRRNLSERLEKIKIETRQKNEWLISLLTEHYTLGTIYFIYDTSLAQLNDGIVSGYFLDENLEINPDITRPTADYLLLRVGSPDPALYTVSEALMISDSAGNDIPAPFPSVSGFSFSKIFSFLISSDRMEYLRHQDAVIRMCQRLQRFGEKEMEERG